MDHKKGDVVNNAKSYIFSREYSTDNVSGLIKAMGTPAEDGPR
jgi:hypothetical protein